MNDHEVCKCGHDRIKHLHANIGGDGKEWAGCTLCAYVLFRGVPR